MQPYLRPAPADDQPLPCPPGHIAESAGLWWGVPTEIVYDPDEHQVCFMRGSIDDTIAAGLEQGGWQRSGVEGNTELWIRDRSAAAERALVASMHSAPSQGLGL